MARRRLRLLTGSTHTPAEMLADIPAERMEIMRVLPIAERFAELEDEQFREYLERYRTHGELDALRWVKEQIESE